MGERLTVFRGQLVKQFFGRLAGVKIGCELHDAGKELFGLAAVVLGQVRAGNPQGGGDAVQLLGVARLYLIAEKLDIGLAGFEQLHTVFVEAGGEGHALLFRLALLHLLKLLFNGEQAVKVLMRRVDVVFLQGAVAQVAGDGKAGERHLFLRILLDLGALEQGDGLLKAAVRAVGIGQVQADHQVKLVVLDRNGKQRLIMAEEALGVQLVVQDVE